MSRLQLVLQKMTAAQLVVLVAVIIGFAARAWFAVSTPIIHDELGDWLPLVQSISFDPDALHLPLRGYHHSAIPAYVMKISALFFGDDLLGYRALNVAFGAATIVVVAVTARQWGGAAAGAWCAILLAFNEYHVAGSGQAIQRSLYLFAVAMSLLWFGRFLAEERPRHLYAAAASAALGYLCYEIGVFVVAAFFATFLLPRQRPWLRRKEPWVAAGVFGLFVAWDVIWNLTNPDPEGAQVSGAGHLERIQGVGFNVEYLGFFLRDAIYRWTDAFGGRLADPGDEYRAMNVLSGAVLLGLVGYRTARFKLGPPTVQAALLCFWIVLGFFFFAGTSDTASLKDALAWWWVDTTIIPAVLVAGVTIGRASGKARLLLAGAATLGCVWGLFGSSIGAETIRLRMTLVPVHVWPPDGRMQQVRALFHPAPLYEPLEDFRLVGIETRCLNEDPGQRQPPGIQPEALHAEVGEADDDFWVRAVSPCEYTARYVVTDARGCRMEIAHHLFAHDDPNIRPPLIEAGPPSCD